MPNQFSHIWTLEDMEFLQKNFNKLPYKELGKVINRSYSSVQSKLRNMKMNKRVNKHSLNSNFFKSWSSDMAYVLGFITSDGNLQQIKRGYHLHIPCDDLDVIEKIKYALNSDMPIRQKPRPNGKISYSLRFSDKTIFNDLVLLGVTPRKSLIIRPPLIPMGYFWDYIRGFFDGDGCVYLNEKSIYPSKLNTYFYTGSSAIAQFLFENLKPYLSLYEGHILKKKENSYVLHFGHKHSEVIFDNMYKNAKIYMERKYNIFLKGLKQYEIKS